MTVVVADYVVFFFLDLFLVLLFDRIDIDESDVSS